MNYVLKDLIVHVTPKTEEILELPNFSDISFEFPLEVKTVLFIHYGLVKSSNPYHEIVGRLYSSEHPQETDENHIGKLYINVFVYHDNVNYETSYEQIKWKEDGSFYTVTQDKEVFHTDSNLKSQSTQVEVTDDTAGMDQEEFDNFIDEIYAKMQEAIKLRNLGRINEALELSKKILNDPRISSSKLPGIKVYPAHLAFLLMSQVIGKRWPQPNTSEYNELFEYLKVLIENYDLLDSVKKMEFLAETPTPPIEIWRKTYILMKQNRPLESLEDKHNDSTSLKQSSFTLGLNAMLILTIIFLIVGIAGAAIGWVLFLVCGFITYKLYRKRNG
jgi:hypothetical protein